MMARKRQYILLVTKRVTAPDPNAAVNSGEMAFLNMFFLTLLKRGQLVEAKRSLYQRH